MTPRETRFRAPTICRDTRCQVQYRIVREARDLFFVADTDQGGVAVISRCLSSLADLLLQIPI